MSLPSLSIVLPCHNEEEVLPDTIRTLNALVAGPLADCISECEYVLVNNGSTDNTLEVMQGLQSEVASFRLVDLRRNYGYQGSISAGLFEARKDVVVTIDADLQDDPTKIKEMLTRYAEGYELVLGIRQSRETDSFLKRVLSQAYYKLIAGLGVESVYNHGEFRLMSQALVQDFREFSETNRYIRGLVLQLESRRAHVYYDRGPREKGETKFSPSRLFALAFDGITSFSSVPIRMVTVAGILTATLAMLVFLYVLYIFMFTGRNVPGWASLATIVLFFSGVQIFSLGVVGEYVAKIYMETKRRPVFSIRKVYDR